MSTMRLSILAALVMVLGVAGQSGAAPLVSENFDSMGSAAGTIAAPPAGWTVGYLGTVGTQSRLAMTPSYAGNGLAITSMTPIYSVANIGVDYRSNYNGGSISDVGHVFNCGSIGAADRALGNYPRSNPSGDHIMQVAFTNNTGAAISSIQLDYDMEQWGWGQGTSPAPQSEKIRVLFSSTSSIAGFTYMGTAFDGLAPHQGPGSPIDLVIDGNAAANKVHVSGLYTLPSTLDPGASMWLRFHDWNDDATTDHLLAIDNVVVLPEPATLAFLAIGGILALRRRSR